MILINMKKLKIKDWLTILKNTLKTWWNGDPFRQSAVIAFYAVFSLPVLLVIVFYLAGIIFGNVAGNGKVAAAISGTLGGAAAKQIEDMIVNVNLSKNTLFATIAGILTLIFTATGVFIELQKSLNIIWHIQPAKIKRGLLKFLKDRLFSFGLVASIGFLLAISLVLTTVLTAISGWISQRFSYLTIYLLHAFDVLFSLSMISVLFALMFKVLPDIHITWKSILPGAILTAFLFIIGKYALGVYFVTFQPASMYGAAGSIVLILLWVSYSCMIVLFGAEFTKQYSISKSS